MSIPSPFIYNYYFFPSLLPSTLKTGKSRSTMSWQFQLIYLSTYWMSTTIIGARNTTVNKTKLIQLTTYGGGVRQGWQKGKKQVNRWSGGICEEEKQDTVFSNRKDTMLYTGGGQGKAIPVYGDIWIRTWWKWRRAVWLIWEEHLGKRKHQVQAFYVGVCLGWHKEQQ